MLQSLYVRNLALIEEAEVEFDSGLNILSGETGAGKSIIIGSVNFALGQKIAKEMFRDNESEAFAELVFDVSDPTIKESLKKIEIDTSDDQVIISRRAGIGRGSSKINGETVPISKIREVASLLLDLYGQHDHQTLTSSKRQLEILDEYAKDMIITEKSLVKKVFHEKAMIEKELKNLIMDEEQLIRELSFLSYEIQEIEEAQLKANEDAEIEAKFKRLKNSNKITEILSRAHAQLCSDNGSAGDAITYALRELSAIAGFDSVLSDFESQLTEIENLLSDLNREISDYLEHVDFDEEEFRDLEKRLDLINHLKSKYGRNLEEIFDQLHQKQERKALLMNYQANLLDLTTQLQQKTQELEKSCKDLSGKRNQAAQKLQVLVKESLLDLNFIDVAFQIQVETTAQVTSNGFDEICFLISTNPGESVKPIEKVASGGELSRIMLAIKSILAENDGIGTLIFDEIDAGISGRTAQRVSEKLNLLSKYHQIICITHLPQIASMSDSHFLIEKEVEQGRTRTKVVKLKPDEEISELARMIGGVSITKTVMESAKEMRQLALTKKRN
ncbi:MAG: DNA repair protein RecN [Lachnospiraceae bacterium]